MENCPLTNIPCPNSKSFSVSQTEGGETVQKHVCEKCAYYEFDKKAKSKLEILMDVIENVAAKHRSSKKCNQCCATYEDLLEKSRFGCDQCYETFRKYVLFMIERCQIGTKHIGKNPKNFIAEEKSINVEDEINNLEKRIKEAVVVEDYEKAALLKEKIRLLKIKKVTNEI
jgi:protein arginine kinase activator